MSCGANSRSRASGSEGLGEENNSAQEIVIVRDASKPGDFRRDGNFRSPSVKVISSGGEV
jgi:hypothetical protein